jgi:hypothetical protein
MADIAHSLTSAFDGVWGRFLGRLDGLGDQEYFWEPVPGGWSVRPGDDGRWRIDGDGYRNHWRKPIETLEEERWWRPIGRRGGRCPARPLPPQGPPRIPLSGAPPPSTSWPHRHVRCRLDCHFALIEFEH